MQVTRYITKGGIAVAREVREEAYQPADNALARGARRSARRAVFVELRVSRPLHALGHGVCRSAAGLHRARSTVLDRGAEPARPGSAAADRRALCRGCRRSARAGRRRPDRRRDRRDHERFSEEQRSRQPSVFSVLRALVDLFGSAEDQHLGLYGAFGYDLVFQFEPMPLRLPRPEDQRDLVLYLPDEILVVDHMRQIAATHRYEFECGRRLDRRAAARDAGRPYRLDRAPALAPERKRPRPGRICRPGRARQGGVCPRRSVRGRPRAAVRRSLRRPAERRLPAAAPGQPGALWRADQSRRGRVSGLRLARDVRAGRGKADRDLPDQRHDRARPRPGRRRRAHPRTARTRPRTRAN